MTLHTATLQHSLRMAQHGGLTALVLLGLTILLGVSMDEGEASAAGDPGAPVLQVDPPMPGLAEAAAEAKRVLLAKHGARSAERIDRGVGQVMRTWRAGDGDAAAFKDLVVAEFIPAGNALDATFERFEFAFERIAGYSVSLSRDLQRGVDLEIGPILPVDLRL